MTNNRHEDGKMPTTAGLVRRTGLATLAGGSFLPAFSRSTRVISLRCGSSLLIGVAVAAIMAGDGRDGRRWTTLNGEDSPCESLRLARRYDEALSRNRQKPDAARTPALESIRR